MKRNLLARLLFILAIAAGCEKKAVTSEAGLDNTWLSRARFQCGGRDYLIPIPVTIKWARKIVRNP